MLYYSDFWNFKEDINFTLESIFSNGEKVCYSKESADTYLNYIQKKLNELKEKNN